MARYLIEATCTEGGGMMRCLTSGTADGLAALIQAVGGRTESLDLTLGDFDLIAIADLPDSVALAALVVRATESGLLSDLKTRPLLTASEVARVLDQALLAAGQPESPERRTATGASAYSTETDQRQAPPGISLRAPTSLLDGGDRLGPALAEEGLSGSEKQDPVESGLPVSGAGILATLEPKPSTQPAELAMGRLTSGNGQAHSIAAAGAPTAQPDNFATAVDGNGHSHGPAALGAPIEQPAPADFARPLNGNGHSYTAPTASPSVSGNGSKQRPSFREEQPLVTVPGNETLPAGPNGPGQTINIAQPQGSGENALSPAFAGLDAPSGAYDLFAGQFARFSELGEFSQVLIGIPGIQSVTTRQFNGGRVAFRIRYDSPVPLLTRLKDLTQFKSEVREVGPRQIEFVILHPSTVEPQPVH